MAGHWKEVVTIQLKGERFREHALALAALQELCQFQKVVTGTAKAIWRMENPGRRRLPPGFDHRTRLYLRTIEKSSAVLPLVIPLSDFKRLDPLEESSMSELADAVNTVYSVFTAIQSGKDVPMGLPGGLFVEYARLGKGLSKGETLEFAPPGEAMTRVTAEGRKRLASFAAKIDEGERCRASATPGGAQEFMEKIAGIFTDVPEEEWAKLPDDLSSRLDYYLYGTASE